MSILVKVKKLDPKAKTPFFGSPGAACSDLFACIDPDPVFGDSTKMIREGQTVMIGTGIAMEIQEGCVGLIYARSGLSVKGGLAPANKVGVIDSDYRGEIVVALHNHGSEPNMVAHGDRIAQMMILEVPDVEYIEVDELNETERDAGGFGSTGK